MIVRNTLLVLLTHSSYNVCLAVDVLLFYTLSTGLEIGVSLETWPALKDHHDLVAAQPSLATYLASEQRFPSPGKGKDGKNRMYIHPYLSMKEKSIALSILDLLLDCYFFFVSRPPRVYGARQEHHAVAVRGRTSPSHVFACLAF